MHRLISEIGGTGSNFLCGGGGGATVGTIGEQLIICNLATRIMGFHMARLNIELGTAAIIRIHACTSTSTITVYD